MTDNYLIPIIVKKNIRKIKVKPLESFRELLKLEDRYIGGENIYIEYQGDLFTPESFKERHSQDYFVKRIFKGV